MPQLNFVKQGTGPMVVLSHALGTDLSMWDEVAALLAPGLTVLRYDHRGHGASAAVDGPCKMQDLADDAAELVREQGAGPVHFVGISMGGMVAQQLASRHPELVASVVIANASSHYDDAARNMWRTRIETVLGLGMSAISEATMQRWFTRHFRESPEGAERVMQLQAVLERCDPRAYVACCEAVSQIDFRASNSRIACPALVIAGTFDESTPRRMSELICKAITGAELATLETAHLSAVERPEEFAALVAGFIGTL